MFLDELHQKEFCNHLHKYICSISYCKVDFGQIYLVAPMVQNFCFEKGLVDFVIDVGQTYTSDIWSDFQDDVFSDFEGKL